MLNVDSVHFQQKPNISALRCDVEAEVSYYKGAGPGQGRGGGSLYENIALHEGGVQNNLLPAAIGGGSTNSILHLSHFVKRGQNKPL